MSFVKNFKAILSCLAIIFGFLIATSVVDIILVVIYPRFYSNALFIVLFSVGGIFAGLVGYMTGMDFVPVKNKTARLGMVSMIVIMGLLFFFLIARIEGGEYKVAFQAYGVTLILSALFAAREKFT